MLMPIASVNEYNGSVLWQHDVGLAGQIRWVKSITKSLSMEKLSDREFWLRVTTLNA
jgi:hypothetical protein